MSVSKANKFGQNSTSGSNFQRHGNPNPDEIDKPRSNVNVENQLRTEKNDLSLPEKFERVLARYAPEKTGRSRRSMKRTEASPDKGALINESYSNPIVDFFDQASNQDILTHLYNFLLKHDACDTRLGSGAIGYVVRRGVGNTYTVSFSNGLTIDLPVVVKEVNMENDIFAKLIDENLFVWNSRGISVEAIILYFVKPLIQLKLSPHLPLILDHGKCIMQERQPIDKIITEMHGLQNEIHVDIPGLFEVPLWKNMDDYNPEKPVFLSRMATFDDLTMYMALTKDDKNNVVLPNGEKCNMIELIDYLSISFLMTYDLLYKHNIQLLDMHPGNIFLHWLNKDSYMHNQYIGDTKFIYYKMNNKYYKIKTFGLILKIGDIGAAILHPRKDLYIAGQAFDVGSTHQIITDVMNMSKAHDFLMTYNHCMTHDIHKQTVAYKITTSHPYDKMHWYTSDRNLIKDTLRAHDMMKMFDKYSVDKIDEKSNYLVF